METMMVAAVLVTTESPTTAEGQQDEDEPRPRKGCVGGPTLLLHAPGNETHDKSEVSGQMFIYRPHWNQESLL